MQNNSVLKAIVDAKCPRCHQGELFPFKASNLRGFYKMNSVCEACKQTFMPEPGFYFGAMFIAYGMLVFMSIITWLTLFFLFQPVFPVYIIIILFLNVLLLPFIFRYSRVLFLFGFGGIKFNKNFLKS